MGQFALACQAIVLPAALLGNAIGNVYYQRAAEMWAKAIGFKELFLTTTQKLILIGLPVYGVVFWFSASLFPIIFGPYWVKAGQYATFLSISSFFYFVTVPLGMTCLIVGVKWYLPLWHMARTASTAFVAFMAWRGSWDIQAFLLALIIQQSILYLFDLWAEYRFAGFSPETLTRKCR